MVACVYLVSETWKQDRANVFMDYAAEKVGTSSTWPIVCVLSAALSILHKNMLGISFLFSSCWDGLVHPPRCWATWEERSHAVPVIALSLIPKRLIRTNEQTSCCRVYCGKTGLRRLWVLVTKTNLTQEWSSFLEENHITILDFCGHVWSHYAGVYHQFAEACSNWRFAILGNMISDVACTCLREAGKDGFILPYYI